MVVVTFELGPLVQAYVQETQLKWPIVVDESRRLYTAYGMNRGKWWNIYGPASIWVYIRLLLRGRKLRRPQGDPDQLGGDVLIDPGGIVRLQHVGSGPADRPSVESLLRVVRGSA